MTSAVFSISCPTRVEFGSGCSGKLFAVLPQDTRRIAFVRGGSGTASTPLVQKLAADGIDVREIICAEEPSILSLNAASDALKGVQVDAVVACGGGAVLDTGKALAFVLAHDISLSEDFGALDAATLARPCPVSCIAIPTTAGTGAEVTANAVLGIPSKGTKVSLRGRAMYPAVALVDPDLLISAPAHVLLGSGLDAVTQVVEAYTSVAATPFSDALSWPAIEPGLLALRRVMEDQDKAALSELAWVSLSSGLALANGGLGAAHGAASVIGGQYAVPHGALCGRLLLPVLRRNLLRAPLGSDAFCRIEKCHEVVAGVFSPLADKDELSGFDAWIAKHSLPRLAEWGIAASDLDRLAEQSLFASSSKKNAVPLDKADFLRILTDAL